MRHGWRCLLGGAWGLGRCGGGRWAAVTMAGGGAWIVGWSWALTGRGARRRRADVRWRRRGRRCLVGLIERAALVGVLQTSMLGCERARPMGAMGGDGSGAAAGGFGSASSSFVE